MKLISTFLLCSQFVGAQVWLQLSDFPGSKRDDGVAVVVNDKAYFGTGLQEWNATIDFYALDLKNNSWSMIPTMPHTTERQYACAFPGTNCFYVFGGDNGTTVLNNIYKYNISTSTWSLVSPKPGNGIAGAVCMSFGDKVIISGGKFSNGKVSNEVWEYNISTDSWTQKNNYPFAGRWRASATVFKEYGYLIFGKDTGGAYRKELYKYDPTADSWTNLGDFPEAKGRAYAALNATNDRLFVFGGYDTLDHYYKDIWYYKESSNTWLRGPDMPAIGRRGGMHCSYGESFFYTCGLGEGSARLTETWMTDVPLGLNEGASFENITVYPNPCTEILHLNFPPTYKELKYDILDVSGRLLYSSTLYQSENIDMTALPKGMYFLKCSIENKLAGSKIIVKE